MAFSSAQPGLARSDASRRSLDAIRIAIGAVSLVGAVGAALYFHAQGAVFVALVGGGILVFAVMLVSFGRLVTRRWLAFGAALGFAPASRRPVLDFGTDRPALFGRAGGHPARLRLVVTRGREGAREWLEADTELFVHVDDLRTQAARASEAARALAPQARVQLSRDRIAVRAPFDPNDALRVLAALREAVAAVERSPQA